MNCPPHQGKFDLRNGAPPFEPVTDALRSYPLKIDGQRVFLQLG